MKEIILKIHRYLAIPFGIFISMLCFTGAIILFRKELSPIIDFLLGEDNAFMSNVMKLHGTLLIPRSSGYSIGSVIIGISAISMTIILITGIILWWPRSKTMLKNRLSLHFNKGLRRFIYDSHVSLGIYSVIFLLLMSLSGPAWSFKWYNSAAKSTLSVFVSNDDTNSTEIQGKSKKRSPEAKAIAVIHTGSWDGYTIKILYLLAAIIGGFLPISGYYMWLKRRRNKKQEIRQKEKQNKLIS